MIQYTTRPQRVEEINDIDYHFIDNDFFDWMLKNNILASSESYKVVGGEVWRYGSALCDFTDLWDKVIITNPEEYQQLISNAKLKDKIRSIYIHCDLLERINRCYSRQIHDDFDNEKIIGTSKEITRRLIHEENSFYVLGDKENYDLILNNNNESDLSDAIDKLVDFIEVNNE